MKKRIATIIASLICAITLSGCYSSSGIAMVNIVGPGPTGYAIIDLPPKPYDAEVAGNYVSQRFND